MPIYRRHTRKSTRQTASRACCFVVFVAGLLLCGCEPRDRESLSGEPRRSAVLIALPVLEDGESRRAVDVLQATYSDAPVMSVAPMEAVCRRAVEEDRVLLLPAARLLPAEGWPVLTSFLENGGRAVLIGRDPLGARVQRYDDRFRPNAEVLADLQSRAVSVDGLSSIQLWRHMNESGVMRGAVRRAERAGMGRPAVMVDVEGFSEWDTLSVEASNGETLPVSANSMAFYARGSETTRRLAFICEEQDGSVWSHTIRLTPGWKSFVVHEQAFRYFHGGNGRGGTEDHFELEQLGKMSIGLSMHLAPQPPGTHQYGVSDVHFINDQRPASIAVEWPDIRMIAPPYRRYLSRLVALDSLVDHRRFRLAETFFESPLPRARGWGGADGAPYRWVPLYEGVDGDGRLRGWPVSLCVEPASDGGLRAWGWVGLDAAENTQDILPALVDTCVERLAGRLFLYKAGLDRMSIQPGDLLRVEARWTGAVADRGRPVRLTAELLDHESRSLRRVSATLAEASAATGQKGYGVINLGEAAVPDDDRKDFALRIALEETGLRGRILDEIVQPLRISTLQNALPESRWMTTGGSRFLLGKHRMFLLGINYWPLSTNGKPPGSYNPHWLDVAMFDPELIRRDLDRLSSVGVNAVAVQYHDEKQAPQLRYFLDEIERRGMWAYIYIPHLSPLEYDFGRARMLIEAANLSCRARAFAFDLAWEPHLGTEGDRHRLDGAWRAWLVEQFGSIEHAEWMLEQPLWRKDGQVTGPPDAALIEDGAHRTAVALYRRFIDDFISRRYGAIRRFLQEAGCRQLLSARSGYGGTGNAWGDRFFPLDLASGALHLDFICPEGWGLAGGREDFLEAGFITVYGRGMSGGKPVCWMEYGSSVGRRPTNVELANQARVYANMLEMLQLTGCSGGFGWWYPSGFRVDENSDMGVVYPDATWRPVGEVMRKYARRLQTGLAATPFWTGRTVERARDARGMSALWDRWRDTYREELLSGKCVEVRPEGFGRKTTDIEWRSFGRQQLAPPVPLRRVNAEWGASMVSGETRLREPGAPLRVRQGERLRLALLNTGPATWAASRADFSGTVWVGLRRGESRAFRIEVPQVAFGESTWIEWTATTPGTWHFRPEIYGFGPFGEPLTVVVAPVEDAAGR